MDARLIVVGGKANKSEVKLKLPTTIGRSRTADLTVAHPKVSRQHCQIFERDGLLVVRDNGSLNGTYIEDAKITESVLKPGEKLTVGPLTFIAAYEPAHADAGTLPGIDPPTPLFEADAVYPSKPIAMDSPPAAAAEGEADAWLDDSPGFSASYEDPPPDSSSWFPEPAEPLVPEPPLTFDNLAAPPAAAPDASDFRLPEVSELAETMPAELPGDEPPRAADVTVDLPPPTVAFERPAPAPAPLSPDDFRAPDDAAGEVAFELPPPTTVPPAADAAEVPVESDEQPWLPAAAEQTAENDQSEEHFGWSPDASPSSAPAVSSETIRETGLDKTTKIEPLSPPAAIVAAEQELAEPPDNPSVATPGTQDASSDRTGKSKGWWPFGGKKKAPAKATSSDDLVEPIPAAPTSPLPSEAKSLHTGTLSPIVLPDDPPAAAVDESAPAETEPSTADDEELSQFLKSLGD